MSSANPRAADVTHLGWLGAAFGGVILFRTCTRSGIFRSSYLPVHHKTYLEKIRTGVLPNTGGFVCSEVFYGFRKVKMKV